MNDVREVSGASKAALLQLILEYVRVPSLHTNKLTPRGKVPSYLQSYIVDKSPTVPSSKFQQLDYSFLISKCTFKASSLALT